MSQKFDCSIFLVICFVVIVKRSISVFLNSGNNNRSWLLYHWRCCLHITSLRFSWTDSAVPGFLQLKLVIPSFTSRLPCNILLSKRQGTFIDSTTCYLHHHENKQHSNIHSRKPLACLTEESKNVLCVKIGVPGLLRSVCVGLHP